MLTRHALLVAGTTLSLAFSSALAETMQVPSEFVTLQSAIDAAVDGDVILLAPGVYSGDGFWELDTAGKAIHIQSLEGPEVTVLDAADFTALFFFNDGEPPEMIVEGLTLTGGFVGGIGGPAVHCRGGSSPTIRNCMVVGNANGDLVGAAGGGIWVDDSSPTFENCTISCNNTFADGSACGDGIYITGDSAPKLRNSIVWGNDNGDDYDICISEGSLTVECSILGTVSEWEPGALIVDVNTVYEDPGFCSMDCIADPVDPSGFHLSDSSVGLPANNSCGEVIGALGIGCPIASTPAADDRTDFRMYPNPTRNVLFLENTDSAPVSVVAYDLQGRIVLDLTPTLATAQAGVASTSVDGLSQGAYLLRVLLEDGSLRSQKLVVR